MPERIKEDFIEVFVLSLKGCVGIYQISISLIMYLITNFLEASYCYL